MSKLTKVFRWRKQRFIVTPKDTEYTLRYLGSMRTLTSRGESCCDYPIRKIWKKTLEGERYVKAKLYLGTKGIRLIRDDMSSIGERKGDKEQFFDLHRITCCKLDWQHPMVFAWIYRHELPRLQVSLRVHVAACKPTKDEPAREIVTAITHMYQTAFELFKRDKRVGDRKLELHTSITTSCFDRAFINKKSRSNDSDDDDDDDGDSISMSEAQPPTPLRRMINTRSIFKPPLAKRLNLPTQMLVIHERREGARRTSNSSATSIGRLAS